jgi:hemerythrin-like metal-binding protein/PAS domain S-box-containing protein
MSILNWNDQLLVGVDSVDNQHRHLVELINRLDEVVAIGEDQQTIMEIVNQLVDYTVYHFQHEDELMVNAGYNQDMLERHRQQHQDFVEKIKSVQIDVKTDSNVVSKDLLDFLVDWLCRHTLKTDKLMAISLNKGIDAAEIEFDKHEQIEILHSNLYSALRESEDRFKELADNLQALIWVTNAKNLPIFCNRYWFKTFGLKHGAVDRQQWLNIIHADDRENVFQTYQKAADELTKFQIQYRLSHADHKLVWILETAVPRVRKNGEFAGLMGCGMDITSQKLAEEALLKLNQELEQRVDERTQALIAANRTLEVEKNQQTLLNRKLKETQAHLVQSEKMVSIGQLAAGVAHEINNPLGYIYSNLNSLKQYILELTEIAERADKLVEALPANHPEVIGFNQLRQNIDLNFLKTDATDLVNESLEGAIRAKKIVQDLRDFSRIDKQEREMFDLEAGLNATLNIVNNELKYKAEVIRQFGGIKPFECVGAQLNQVFMNLLINAAHAIEEFGKITIRTGYMADDWIWVEVEDTGCGISDDIKAKIFDPFFTTKPVGQGTGLGLSLSYKIIKDHFGHILVHSTPGQGTKFRIELPVHPQTR